MSRPGIQIRLKRKERRFLKEFLRKGTRKAREIARANVLLLTDKGYDTNRISETLGIHRQAIWRIKKRYLEEGLESALKEKPRPGHPKKYTEKHEAEIIATACTTPPEGSKRWTIELLTEECRKIEGLETINRESVRLILKKARLNRG